MTKPIAFGNATNKRIRHNKNKTKALLNAPEHNPKPQNHQKPKQNISKQPTTKNKKQKKTYTTKLNTFKQTLSLNPKINHQKTTNTITHKTNIKRARPTGLAQRQRNIYIYTIL